MRFIQFADVHLDSYIGGALNLPDSKRASLRHDIRTAFTKCCSLTNEYKANLVLIPGDLFDYECLDISTDGFLKEVFRSIAPAKVFITPGNHDSLRPGNPYLHDGQSDSWPDNVHIFTTSEFETVVLDDLDCAVTGIAHAHRGVTDRVLSKPIKKPGQAIEILLFHGSRDSYRPSEKENVIPFSDEELLAQGFTYSAIGHYHSFSQVTDTNGVARASYSGCVQGRGLDETGQKYALVGEIDSEKRVTLEKIEVASRRIISLEVDVTGSSNSTEVMNRIENYVDMQAHNCDVVNISLTGTLSPNLTIDTSVWESSAPYFHVNIDQSKIEPDYDLESLTLDSAASSIKSAFVRRMLDLQSQAADEKEKQILRDATYYGLYALDGKKLEPRDAD